MATENLYAPNCIRTNSGIYFNLLAPTIDMVCIEDIAHSLSMQCRFGGHLKRHYSVAEHCVRVAEALPLEYRFSGLMHDASEAYIVDVPRPAKMLLPGYKALENNIMITIAKKFGFTWPMPKEVERADNYLLSFEWDTFMLSRHEGMRQELAKQAFLHFFETLKP